MILPVRGGTGIGEFGAVTEGRKLSQEAAKGCPARPPRSIMSAWHMQSKVLHTGVADHAAGLEQHPQNFHARCNRYVSRPSGTDAESADNARATVERDTRRQRSLG
jgi:hypothetical protein